MFFCDALMLSESKQNSKDWPKTFMVRLRGGSEQMESMSEADEQRKSKVRGFVFLFADVLYFSRCRFPLPSAHMYTPSSRFRLHPWPLQSLPTWYSATSSTYTPMQMTQCEAKTHTRSHAHAHAHTHTQTHWSVAVMLFSSGPMFVGLNMVAGRQEPS